MIIFIVCVVCLGALILRNIYSINRGYEEVASHLNAIRADIKLLVVYKSCRNYPTRQITGSV